MSPSSPFVAALPDYGEGGWSVGATLSYSANAAGPQIKEEVFDMYEQKRH
jgi:hypothetical protein